MLMLAMARIKDLVYMSHKDIITVKVEIIVVMYITSYVENSHEEMDHGSPS